MKFLWATLFICLSLLSGCKTTDYYKYDAKKQQKSVQETIHSQIIKAQNFYDDGQIIEAISLLQSLIKKNSYRPVLDRAYVLLIAYLLEANREQEAKVFASFFLRYHGHSTASKKIIKLFDNYFDEDTKQILETPYLKKELKNPKDKIVQLTKKIQNAQTPNERIESKNRLKNLITYDVDLSIIKDLWENAKLPFIVGLAGTRLANYYFHVGNLIKAYDTAAQSIGLVDEETKTKLFKLQKDIETIRSNDKKTIGILLPLTGNFAPFGKKALFAMSIALGVNLENSKNEVTLHNRDDVTIVIADSKGDIDTTKTAVKKLIKDYNAAIIVGDILAETSYYAAQIANRYKTSLVSLSKHHTITNQGKGVFSFNLANTLQVKNIVDYAFKQKNHRRFALLFPKHDYGTLMAKHFHENVIKKGGEVVAIESYDPHETTFTTTIKKLIGMHHLDARPDYLECLEEVSNLDLDDEDQKEKLKKDCYVNISPKLDFDAIFMPDFHKTISYLIPALVSADILVSNDEEVKKTYALSTKNENPKYIQLLGPSSWDNNELFGKIGNQANGSYFVNAVDFDSSNQLKIFAKAFVNKNFGPATNLEVFAHDAILLALNVLENSNSKNEIRKALKSFNGKVGLLENINFNEKGKLILPIAGFEIHNGKPISLSTGT